VSYALAASNSVSNVPETENTLRYTIY